MDQTAVDALLAWQSAKDLENTAENLRARGFTVTVCPTRDAARAHVLALCKPAVHVGFGGSLSVACLNVTRELREQGKEILNHGFPNLTPEERLAIMRKQLTCDCFLSSVNALTTDGIIVNIDGNGNRVCAMAFGPKQVVLVIGRNKLIKGGVPEALARIAAIAGPVNAYRLGRKTPCANSGKCVNCVGVCPESICRISTVIRQRPALTPTHILLVNEDLGL